MRSIFDANPMSAWELTLGGVGFYIPGYQREYSWDTTNIDRLFEGFGHGLQMLQMSDKKDAVTFIGALIVIHDVKYETVEPSVKGQLPDKVLLIIDGQQRLSTILMVNTILHEQLSVMLHQLKRLDQNNDPAIEWIANQIAVAREKLKMTYELDMHYGQNQHRWYPRIIRAYDDTWSRESNRSRYQSPIAAFLHGYAAFARLEEGREYSHIAPLTEEKDRHNKILQNYVVIRSRIKELAEEKTDYEVPSLETMVQDLNFQDALLSERLPDFVTDRLSNKTSDFTGTFYSNLLRLLFFSQYLIQRVAVTLVTAKNEDYAFDMFEALNTTGTPLTAFETFRPRVISAEKQDGYEKSPSRQYMKSIEEFLEAHKKADDKQDATDRLLIPFALAESGHKLSKKLREQRAYLKLRFEELGTLDEKRLFVEHMSHISVFIKDYWPKNSDEPSKIADLALTNKQLSTLCLEVLRESAHEITIAPLARFFSQIQLAAGDDRDWATKEFERALRAMTAFWIFWRSVRRSTGGIDARYREIMDKGDNKLGIKSFARRSIFPKSVGKTYIYSPRLVADNLIAILRESLTSRSPRINNKADWVQYAREVPIYEACPKPIARIILLAANHDTLCSKSRPGLVEVGRNGIMPMLTIEQWKSSFTIEHIAPNSQDPSGWCSDLYEDPDLVHQIGNLTLLPQVENSVVGNRPWKHKRAFYKILSARSPKDLELKLKGAASIGLNIKINTQKLLENSQCLPHVEALSTLDGEWNTGFVKKRSEQILELAWDRIAPWLGF